MMSRKQRCVETVANSKTNTSTQKKEGKDRLTVPVSSGGKHAGSSTSKTNVAFGRGTSQIRRSSDSTASASRAVGSLNRDTPSLQGTRKGSHPGQSALRLCSSRSFSSLHTSSLTAAPFKRSSRSLSRLEQKSPTRQEHASKGSQVKRGLSSEKKRLDSGRRSSSEEQIGNYKDQGHDDNAGKIKSSISSELLEHSSSLVSTNSCNHSNKAKDGVYALCAMTSGMRRNWVQAVLKNVRPSFTSDVTNQKTQQKSPQPDSGSTEDVCLQKHNARERAEDLRQRESEQEPSSADGNSAPAPIIPQHEVEEGNGADPQCPPLDGNAQADLDYPSVWPSVHSLWEEGGENHISMAMVSWDGGFDKYSNVESESQQSCQQVKTTLSDQQAGQLVKELEQTQRELSRLQQLNRSLQEELQHDRERLSFHPQNDYSNPSEQALALQQLQKINRELRLELETQRRSQEEAREAELQRRVDLLAQQAQLLVTGDATALAQAHLEQDRQRFHKLQMEWEHCVSTLQAQLSTSEAQRQEAESRVTQMQQQLRDYPDLQQETERLQKHLHEVKTQLCANEEAQAEKEARLQKHLVVLQGSQDRERRSLAASLEQAEQHSKQLQEQLDRAEQQVKNLNETHTWSGEIEKAQQQLQDELSQTVSAVQGLQDEKEQLERRCQELQNQLSEADGRVGRLQSRLKTEETHYYNVEHTHERVCEELQVSLGKVQQRESEIQEIREGYERLLDRKEQELSEILLKMEVLGNSLEETEVKLNDVLKERASAQPRMSEPFTVNDSRQKATESGPLSNSLNGLDAVEGNWPPARERSRSIDQSCQHIVTAGNEPERFMSVIQSLENKLYLTEEKLRDITQELEERPDPVGCQEPHLYSQLTQCRATAQHLGLLLHSQAKRSQRFAQEMEGRSRVLVGRFQLALDIVHAGRESLRAAPINIAQFEKQLATAAACLQQGEREAEEQQHESHDAGKGEEKILKDEALPGAHGSVSAKCTFTDTLPSEDGVVSVGRCLKREQLVIEKMLAFLSQNGIGLLSLVTGQGEGDVAHRYKNVLSQRLGLKTEEMTPSGRAEYDGPLERAIGRACAEAELIYAALKLQQPRESLTQTGDQQVGSLADINPPELAPYEKPVKAKAESSEESTEPDEKEQWGDRKVEAEKEAEWLERLTSRLQRRAGFLNQLSQEISGEPGSESRMDDSEEKDSEEDMNWIQEQAKLIYLSERLHLVLEQQLQQQSEAPQNELQAPCKEQDATSRDERQAFNHTVCQLQEDNSLLRGELERAERKVISVETGNQRLLEDIQQIEDYHQGRLQTLETKFQEKIQELQQIHEEEMKHLHGYYAKEKQTKTCTGAQESYSSAPDQAEVYHRHLRKVKDHGFSAMEEIHRKLMGDLQQQHQAEVAALLKEKDQLLQEETAATLAAIVAMRRAYKEELEKSRQSQHSRESADIPELHIEYEKEMQLLHKELEVLSLQHTQKCLEYSQLSQELQDERKSSMQYQNENQELKKKQRETDEMPQLHFSLNGKQSHTVAQINDFYEMEVILRAREAEMQFLRQEACSLREELKIARMDKIYAQNKLKALCAQSNDGSHGDVRRLSEDFHLPSWSARKDASGQSLKDSATGTPHAGFLKKREKSSLTRQMRVVRSKSLKDALSSQERMKLFE